MSEAHVRARALGTVLPPDLVGYVLRGHFNVLLLGDHHYRTNNAPETAAFEKRVHEMITFHRPDAVINLGDTLDTHERINVRPLVRAKSFIQSIADRVPIFVLIGNHDRPNNSDFQSDLHPFGALSSYPGVHIIERAQIHKIKDEPFLFVPYVPPGRLAEAILTVAAPTDDKEKTGKEAKTVDPVAVEAILSSVRAVFAHQEFQGARMGAVRSVVGDRWAKHWPPCYSGHVHDYDELQSNLTYVGAPLEHAFGAAKTQGVSLLAWPSVRAPLGAEGISHDHIRLPLVIRKRVTVAATPATLEDVKLPQQQADLLPPMVRIVVRGTDIELKGIGTHPLVRQWRKDGIKVDFKATVPEARGRPTKELAVGETYGDALFARLLPAEQTLLAELLQ